MEQISNQKKNKNPALLVLEIATLPRAAFRRDRY
jgi:hypothetical protein